MATDLTDLQTEQQFKAIHTIVAEEIDPDTPHDTPSGLSMLTPKHDNDNTFSPRTTITEEPGELTGTGDEFSPR